MTSKQTIHARGRRARLAGLAALVLSSAAFGLTGPAGATCTEDGCYEPPGGATSSSRMIALDGPVHYEPANELVDVAAPLHLTANPDADGLIRLHANVAGATATGQVTGASYALTGADRAIVRFTPGGPPIRTAVSFRLKPEGPPVAPAIPGNPVRVAVRLELRFDDAGNLTAAAASFDGGHD